LRRHDREEFFACPRANAGKPLGRRLHRNFGQRQSVAAGATDERSARALEIGRPILPPILLWPEPLDLRLVAR
jgi:hypothetical protein